MLEINNLISEVVPDSKPGIFPVALAVIAGVLLWSWYNDQNRGGEGTLEIN